jgi:peptidoglycan L-alanyl-D-glutamate endopeptidase CwlK
MSWRSIRKMSSRSLDDLDSRFRPFVDTFISACATQNLDILIYCTYRSNEEQDILYAQGRTTPGGIITNARAGQSAHNYRLAFDGCPMLGGKPLWDEHLTGPHWSQYGQIAVASGMEWGGNWQGFVEGPHCQMANWKQIAGIA